MESKLSHAVRMAKEAEEKGDKDTAAFWALMVRAELRQENIRGAVLHDAR